MKLIEFLNDIIKNDGFLIIDANMNKHLIGHPKKENPITLKILDKSLHTKLLLLPDLYFGEAYANGSVVIENGTLTEFLDLVFQHLHNTDVVILQDYNKGVLTPFVIENVIKKANELGVSSIVDPKTKNFLSYKTFAPHKIHSSPV